MHAQPATVVEQKKNTGFAYLMCKGKWESTVLEKGVVSRRIQRGATTPLAMAGAPQHLTYCQQSEVCGGSLDILKISQTSPP